MVGDFKHIGNVSRSSCTVTASKDRMMELEGIWKEAIVAKVKVPYCPLCSYVLS
jgi:hypothetical protein